MSSAVLSKDHLNRPFDHRVLCKMQRVKMHSVVSVSMLCRHDKSAGLTIVFVGFPELRLVQN